MDVGSPYDGRTKHIVVSPAASIVAAAAGVPVLMHGERDMGPKRGVAVGEVVEALGIATDLEPERVEAGIEECGLGYVRQARVVPALYALKPLREELGLRTPLHMVEKIYDPGNAPLHLIGVAHMPYLEHLAPTLTALGFERTMVVQGLEGHEDVTTSRGSRVIEMDADGEQHEWRLDPAALGVEPATDGDLEPGDALRSAQMTLRVLEGAASSSERDLVALNAALRIKLAGRASSIEEGLDAARRAMQSGDAKRRLDQWRAIR
jgi:anthranilate phosphoribosyltransferase